MEIYTAIPLIVIVSFMLGGVVVLFLTKKGASLRDALKASDTINLLSKQVVLKDQKISLLEKQNRLLIQEVKALEKSLKEMKEDYEKLVKESLDRDRKIKGMEFILQENNKAIKVLSEADRDLEEWKDTLYDALKQFTDLPDSLIEKLTDRTTRKPGERL